MGERGTGERGGEVGAHDGGRDYGSVLEEDGDDGEVKAVVQLRGGVDRRRVEAAASGGLVTKLRGVGGIRAEAGGRPSEGGTRRSGRGNRRRRRADGIGVCPDPDRAEEGERGVRGGNGDRARVRCPQGVIGQGREWAGLAGH